MYFSEKLELMVFSFLYTTKIVEEALKEVRIWEKCERIKKNDLMKSKTALY